MNQILIHQRIGKSIILTCLLLFLLMSFVWASEDIIGEWEMKIEHDGLERFATLSFSKKADGSLEGSGAPVSCLMSYSRMESSPLLVK